MILYHAQGSCSEGILMLLRLSGAKFDLQPISFAQKDQQSPAFRAKNPKGKVPLLELDTGELITEYPVISQFIAEKYPQARLLPEGGQSRRETLSMVEYIVSTLHMRGAALVFRPERFTTVMEAHAEIAANGRSIVAEGYELLSKRLGAADWFYEQPGSVEAAAYFITGWAPRLGLTLPDNLLRLRERISSAAGA